MNARQALRRLLAAVCTMSAVAAVAVLAVLTPSSGSASAAGDGPFLAGTRWTGEFPGASILRVGSTYYAYSTATGGDNLPVLHSRDLTHWYARDAYPSDDDPGWWKGYNDALPHPASWALYDTVRNGHRYTRPWGPSVAAIGSHYVLAYAVPLTASNPNRHCISVATSSNPQGAFVDRTRSPLVCSSDPNGSIDPDVFTTGSSAYLIWKDAGRPGSSPTQIWSRQLSAGGTSFAAGSRAHLLQATAQAWEGNVIEGPSMIAYGGRYYLFWAGNRWATAQYAIGYAICRTPLGGCRRQSRGPLLATRGDIAGPGSPAPVVTPSGVLRLGYSAWDRGKVGYEHGGHRRLHVATLAAGRGGRLQVTALG